MRLTIILALEQALHRAVIDLDQHIAVCATGLHDQRPPLCSVRHRWVAPVDCVEWLYDL